MIPAGVIEAIRARCAVFANRVGGAAEFKALPENAALAVPAAFVIPLDDSPDENLSQNDVRQRLRDGFAVVVAVSNLVDERGQSAAAALRSIRADLWRALLGWRPTADYNGVVYQGGGAIVVDRARVWYQFEFGADFFISPEDGYQLTQIGLLPDLESVGLDVQAFE